MKIQEKDNTTIYKKLIKSRIFFIFLIPIFLALVFGIFQKIYYRYGVEKDLNQLNTEIAKMKQQKNDLNKLVNYYNSAANIEKEAREKLNMKKEGEKVVIILPAATSTSDQTISENVTGGYMPNYIQWWYYFFK